MTDLTPAEQRRAELDAEIEYLEACDKLVAAKQGKDRGGKTHRAAQVRVNELRAYWRGLRENATAGDGEARPDSIKTTARKG